MVIEVPNDLFRPMSASSFLLFSLARHSTCPVCRQRLGNDGGGEQEQDGGEGQDVGDEELLGMSFDD